MRQRQASPHTIANYRDTFRLLMQYARQQLHKSPSQLTLSDLDTAFLGAFLDHLEQKRDNSARSRNVRLSAIHSCFRYVALHAPEYNALAQRVLAIPSKRYLRRPLCFLTTVEIDFLLAAPNLNTWSGRRDRALLLLAVQTGLRASEVIGLRCENIVLGTGAHVQCLGKGRKTRCTPLRKDTVTVLRAWLRERQGQPSDPVLPTTRGQALGSDGLEYLLKHLDVARRQCPERALSYADCGCTERLAVRDLGAHKPVPSCAVAIDLMRPRASRTNDREGFELLVNAFGERCKEFSGDVE